MAASLWALGRKKRRGFSLIELIVVTGILGITVMIGLANVVPALKRSRVGTAAEEVKSLSGRTLTEMQNRNVPAFLVFGKYVPGVGTDVVVSIDGNNDGDGFDVDKNNDGLFDDPDNDDRVLWRTRVPDEVALSNTSPTGQTFNSQWLRPTSGSVSAALMCDFRGRAMIPGAAPTMITGPATIQFCHRDMIDGTLTPLVTYTVSIGPLFKPSIARVP